MNRLVLAGALVALTAAADRAGPGTADVAEAVGGPALPARLTLD